MLSVKVVHTLYADQMCARARVVPPLFSERDRESRLSHAVAHKVHIVVVTVAVVVIVILLPTKITVQWEACKQWLRARRLAALSSSRLPAANRRGARHGANGNWRRTVQYPSVPCRDCMSSIQ